MNRVALQRLPRIWVWVAIAIFGLLVTLCFEIWVEPVLAEVLSDKPPADHIAITGESGKNHTCVLTASGGVKCWGSNEYGQLGDGSTTDSAVPVDVSGLSSDVVAVSAADKHTCALTAAGGVKCWGWNSSGQLGNGSTTDSAVPVDVSGLSSGVTAIDSGGGNTCALTASGGVKCWGDLYFHGGTFSHTPEDIDGLSGGVVAISTGGGHTCALTASGGVKCWGLNNYGQLGDDTTDDSVTPPTPVDVIGLSSDVVAISSGGWHTCALTESGGVKCWGQNNYGQLGDGTRTNRLIPVDVGGLPSGVVNIVAGYEHTCAQTLADGAKCWGQNDYGQLGSVSTGNSTVPVDVGGLPGRLAALTAGGSHTCALTASGGVKCWGWNEYGQLGNGGDAPEPEAILVDVDGLSSGVTAIASGGWHTCALTASGGIKCWGQNDRGQLGDGTRNDRPTPEDVSGLTSGISAIVSSLWHTCALTEAGGVKCWGMNEVDGPFPAVPENDRLTPVDVSGLPGGVSAITAGTSHTCGLIEAGFLESGVPRLSEVKCWGQNRYGGLGDGTTTPRSTPVNVVGLPGNVIAIDAGGWHTCALTASGGVKCWGWNYTGQLGDGTTIDRYTPVDVSGLSSGVTAIEIGPSSACALTASGGVKCWGSNSSGQLGDGTTIDRSSPVDASVLPDDVIRITIGAGHTCALTALGGVKCWGWNNSGQLGDGSTTNSTVPVDVSGLSSDVVAISAGFLHTCALTTSGGVKCWGSNSSGQLGGIRGDTAPKDVIGLEGVEGPEHASTVVQPQASWGTRQHFPVPVTFTAHVYSDSGRPGGMVFFRDANTVIGAAPLDSKGAATITTSSLVAGTHRIFAQYTGSSDQAGSISGPLLNTILPNTPPAIDGTIVATVAAESSYSFTPTASDAEGDSLTFSITNKPAWASFDTTTGALTGTPTNDDVGTTADISICVSDGVLSTCLPAFDLEVTYTNHAPTISGTPPTTTDTYRAYYFLPIASDPDGDSLTFSISNAPTWASFDPATGTLSGTPGKADAGTTTGIIISVSDGELSASLPPFDLTVTHTNHAPIIYGTPATMVAAYGFYRFAPIASDVDGDSLTFSISDKPSWASFDTATGTLSGIPSSSDIGVSTNIVIEVSDGELSASLAFDLTVTDSDPTVIVVSSSADSGPGSLRQAILDSPLGSTILLLSDVNLQSSLVIDKDLIITAPDGVRFTIKPQAGVKTRLFHITAGNVELRNLSLENGTAEGSEGTTGAGRKTIIVTLYPFPIVVEMETTGGGGGSAGYGGAILSETGGTLIIRNVHFTNNVARGGRGGDGIQSSEFEWSGDSGENGGGNIGESEYAGHGGSGVKYDQYVCLNLFNPLDPTTWPEPTLDDCKHYLWTTGGGGGGGGSGLGGAILVAQGTLEIYGSTFSNNIATGGAAGDRYTENDPCDHLRTDGECSELDGTPVPATPGQGKGGAIFAVPGSVVRLYGVQNSGNSASSAGTATACPARDDSDHCGEVSVTTPEAICSAVTTEADLSFCINWANSTTAPNTIGLRNNITLSEDLPAITSDITIEGGGHYLSGNSARNVFSVAQGGDLKLSQITIQDGLADYGGGIFNAGQVAITDSTLTGNAATNGGGSIYNVGNLTVTNSTLSGNAAISGGGIWNDLGTLTVTNSTLSGNTASGDGGGIHNAGTLTVTSSTLSGNTATSGGGIYNIGGALAVTSSTLSGNTATSGGGIYNIGGALAVTSSTLSGNTASESGGGIYNNIGAVTVTNSTLSGNTAAAGGGIYNAGTLAITSSTLSGNSATEAGGGIYQYVDLPGMPLLTGTLLAQNSGSNCSSATTDEGYNLSDDDSCGFSASGSGNNAQLNLGPLANNGGPTQTHALPEGSPAVDAGGASCPDTDQRGEPRPKGAACDVGAYESSFANRPPVAADDSVLTQEDTPITINVADNDDDQDGNLDPTSATVTTDPTNGIVFNNGDGTFTYTPAADYVGLDVFIYRIYDTLGLWDEASVNIEVAPANDPPVAVYDSAATPENMPVIIDVAANDNDPDDNLDPTSATVTTDPTGGSVVNNDDGSFTYTPDPDYSGVDSFNYEICDTDGLCGGAAVTVEVVPLTVSDTISLNKAIEIVNAQAAGQFTITFAGDITLNTVTTPISLQPGVTLAIEGMEYSLDGNGSFRGFTIEVGEVEIRNLTITNCSSENGGGIWNEGALTVTNSTLLNNTAQASAGGGGIYNYGGLVDISNSILSGNRAPSGGGITNWLGGALTITDSTVSDNSANGAESGQGGGVFNAQYATLAIVSSTLSNNSSDGYGGGIDNTGVVEVTNSTLSGNRAHDYGGGGIHNWSDGTVAITNSTLAGNSAGGKGGGISNEIGTVTVTNSIVANSPAGGNCAGGITDGGHNISDDATCGTFAQSDPLLGPLADNGGATWTHALLEGSPARDAGGDVCPDTDQRGEPRPQGAACDIGAYEAVPIVGNPPVAADDSAITPENTPVTIDVVANDNDPDDNLDPTTAVLKTEPASGSIVNNGDGSFTYTPDPDYSGSDSFDYEICDTEGLCDMATVSIEVTPDIIASENNPPEAVDDSATTVQDTPVAVDVAANDSDVDGNLDPATATTISEPGNGNAANNGDGTFTYTPDPGFTGSDSFDYEICDTEGLCDTAAVSIEIEPGVPAPENNPPEAVDDSATTVQDTPVAVDAAANDSDVDGNLDPATATTISEPGNGNAANNGDGTFTYTPDPGFTGSDSFDYEICDTEGLCDTAVVSIEVTPTEPPAPIKAEPEINVSVSTPEVVSGEPFTFTIDVFNPGSHTLDNVLINSRIPGKIKILEAEGVDSNVTVNNKGVMARIAHLAAGQHVFITIEAKGDLGRNRGDKEYCNKVVLTYLGGKKITEECCMLLKASDLAGAAGGAGSFPTWIAILAGAIVLLGLGAWGWWQQRKK